MRRRFFYGVVILVVLSGCIKSAPQDEETQKVISSAEGVGQVDSANVTTPKPQPRHLGDSEIVQGVMYQVRNFQQLRDTSRLLSHLPKSDSIYWFAITVHCQNRGGLNTQPQSGTLEIARLTDTLHYGAIIFRTDWRQVSLQSGESGSFTAVYKTPKNVDGKWYWHPSGVLQATATSFLLR